MFTSIKYSSYIKMLFITLGVALFSFFSASSHAGVVINGTRAVYDQKEKSITVQLTNKGADPVLVQSWIDNGNADATPQNVQVPFVLTPPINRVEPNKGQALRISYTGKPLPQDRESVFWLNVLEIPPTPEANGNNSNLLQMAFRSRIKLFFRPENLKGSPEDAAKNLVWTLDRGKVSARNSSGFNVSLVTVGIKDDSRKPAEGKMIAPDNSQSFPIEGVVSGKTIIYKWINDYGAVVSSEVVIK
jgi:chaperone protein EcpD